MDRYYEIINHVSTYVLCPIKNGTGELQTWTEVFDMRVYSSR